MCLSRQLAQVCDPLLSVLSKPELNDQRCQLVDSRVLVELAEPVLNDQSCQLVDGLVLEEPVWVIEVDGHATDGLILAVPQVQDLYPSPCPSDIPV